MIVTRQLGTIPHRFENTTNLRTVLLLHPYRSTMDRSKTKKRFTTRKVWTRKKNGLYGWAVRRQRVLNRSEADTEVILTHLYRNYFALSYSSQSLGTLISLSNLITALLSTMQRERLVFTETIFAKLQSI